MDRKRKLLWRLWIFAAVALVFAYPVFSNSSWELGKMTKHLPWALVSGWALVLVVSTAICLVSVNSLVSLHEETKAAKRDADAS